MCSLVALDLIVHGVLVHIKNGKTFELAARHEVV